jgi:DNA transformation protein and related proteins
MANAARDAFAAHCVELLAPLGAARSKRMFGGHGLYVDELFIAIVVGEQLYLKVDAQTQAAFERAGSRPFSYEAQGRRQTMSYWAAPEAALESAAQMQPWARLALEAALRARASRPVSTRRRPSTAPAAAAATPRKPAPSASRSKRSPRGA